MFVVPAQSTYHTKKFLKNIHENRITLTKILHHVQTQLFTHFQIILTESIHHEV